MAYKDISAIPFSKEKGNLKRLNSENPLLREKNIQLNKMLRKKKRKRNKSN